MKRNICLALAALGMAAAVAMPADASYSLLLDYSSPDGLAQAAPPQGEGTPFWVRINAVRTEATDAVVGDLQFRFHYDSSKVDDSGLNAVTAGSSSFYAAAVSAAATADNSVAGTDSRRTVLVSADPTDAPLSFAVGTNRGVAVGDIAPIAAVGLATAAGFPIDVTEATAFGVSADPDFPQIARSELAGVYTDVAGLTIDVTTFLSYDPAVDKDGDGRADTAEGDFIDTLPPDASGTNVLLFDSSADGISDGLKVLLGLDPVSDDTDGDGIIDGVELRLMQAGAVDNDGNLFDPAVANVYTSTLGDGVPDVVGVVGVIGNPDSNVDSDSGTDGASNAYEVATGYDPMDSTSFPPIGDVNGDGVADLTDVLAILGYSLQQAGFSPYANDFPLPTNAGPDPSDLSVSLGDVFEILNYSLQITDQIR
jgi:hypothetical protein